MGRCNVLSYLISGALLDYLKKRRQFIMTNPQACLNICLQVSSGYVSLVGMMLFSMSPKPVLSSGLWLNPLHTTQFVWSCAVQYCLQLKTTYWPHFS